MERTRIAGLAVAGLVVVLLLIPPVRQGMLLELGLSVMPARTAAFFQSLNTAVPAHQTPQDVGEAMVIARNQASKSKSLKPFASMIEKYPESPALYSCALRYACKLGPLQGPARPEIDPKASDTPAKDRFRQLADTPDVRLVEKAIEAGERLDPGNAYFDWFEVALRFRQGRDDEALAAVRRAAGGKRFLSHDNQEILAQCREVRRRTGGLVDWMNPLGRYGAANTIVYAHLKEFRLAGRMVGWHIERDAKAGRRDQAFALMMDQVRAGAIMRDHSWWGIDALIGVAIQGTAIQGAYRGLVGPVPQSSGKVMGLEYEKMISAIQSKAGSSLSPADWKYLHDQVTRAGELRDKCDVFVRTEYTHSLRAMIANSVLLIHACVFSTVAVVFIVGAFVWGFWLRRRGRQDLKAGPTRLSVLLLAVLPALAPAAWVLAQLGATRSADDMWFVFSGAAAQSPWLFAFIVGLLVFGIAAIGAQRHGDGQRFDAFLSRLRVGSIYAAQAICVLYVLTLLVCVPIAARGNRILNTVLTTGELPVVWQINLPAK